MKPISFKGLNTRLRRLEAEFGSDSEIVKTAKEYIKERITKYYITDTGYIKQDKETVEKLGKKKWTSYDEYVPTVTNAYKNAYDYAVNDEPYALAPGQQGPEYPYQLDKISDAKNDPVTRRMLAKQADYIAHMLNTSSDIIDTLYEAKDPDLVADNGDTYPRQSEAYSYWKELCENAYLAKQLEWLNKISELTNDFLMWKSQHSFEEEW
jgi:hypothetical protein